MIYEGSRTAVIVFAFFVAVVLGMSLFLGKRAKSARGYYAAHGQIPWFINGVAFAGDYLSAASFLGICGMIAFYGYDGFLYSIGYLAGWVVALLIIAEPMKRLGRFTFADALDNQFNSRGIKCAAAISTLVISIFYLIPQMVGAGTLVKPLLGFSHQTGVLIVGAVVILIVVTAGMVSTTWVQFIKGSMLVVFCALLTIAILARGLTTTPHGPNNEFHPLKTTTIEELRAAGAEIIPESGAWTGRPYVRVQKPDKMQAEIWWVEPMAVGSSLPQTHLTQTQWVSVVTDSETGAKTTFVNGLPRGRGPGQGDLFAVGHVSALPNGQRDTGSLGPLQYIKTLQDSTIVLWRSEIIKESPTVLTTVYYQAPTRGDDVLVPGLKFKGLRGKTFLEKLDFVSLMLALFCGTASLPHILIRYYTVKDQASARKSTVVGIASIGFFYVLTLYLGLGAMTSGTLDVTNDNMSAPLLAKSFGELPFAIISAIAFTTVLGTVSGLILAASGAVAHDLMENVFKVKMDDDQKVRAGKVTAVVVGLIAIVLGILFEKLNVSFLVGWAFSVAASANLPALVMLLFWKRTTKHGITAAIIVGMVSSLTWILLSAEAYEKVYFFDLKQHAPIVPFTQPGIITIPLGFIVLIVVSLLTQNRPGALPKEPAIAR